MAQEPKITTGANDRPRNETIGQTGGGAPDDSSRPVEADDAQIKAVRDRLFGGGPSSRKASGGPANPEAVSAGTPGSAENTCRRCQGTGRLDGEPCPDCEGTGKVTTPVGGGG